MVNEADFRGLCREFHSGVWNDPRLPVIVHTINWWGLGEAAKVDLARCIEPVGAIDRIGLQRDCHSRVR